MGLADKFKKICISLGENNKPTYAVMAIAVVKGIARPAFTMMDKHEEPETKKYTALREGLTEVVAIPTYWASGELASKIAGSLKLSPEKKELAKHNFMFLGVCTAALFIIPALASAAIKPFMNKIQGQKKKENEPQHKLDITETEINEKVEIAKTMKTSEIKPYRPISINQYTPAKMAGMKVGASW